jgi:hypothetical protein
MISDDPAKGLGRAPPEQLFAEQLRRVIGKPARDMELIVAYWAIWQLRLEPACEDVFGRHNHSPAMTQGRSGTISCRSEIGSGIRDQNENYRGECNSIFDHFGCADT